MTAASASAAAKEEKEETEAKIGTKPTANITDYSGSNRQGSNEDIFDVAWFAIQGETLNEAQIICYYVHVTEGLPSGGGHRRQWLRRRQQGHKAHRLARRAAYLTERKMG